MKIFLLAACLLMVTTVKAIDLEKVQALKEHLQECEEASPIGKIPGLLASIRPDLLFCAFKKAGVIDEHNYFGMKGIVSSCNAHTIDPIQCQKITFSCYQQGAASSNSLLSIALSTESSNKESVIKLLQCLVINGLMKLIPA